MKPAPKPAVAATAVEQAGKKKPEPEKTGAHESEPPHTAPVAAKPDRTDKHPRPPAEPVKPARVEPVDKHHPAKQRPDHSKLPKHDKVEKPKPAAASAKSGRTGKAPAVSLKRKSPTKQLAKRKPR